MADDAAALIPLVCLLRVLGEWTNPWARAEPIASSKPDPGHAHAWWLDVHSLIAVWEIWGPEGGGVKTVRCHVQRRIECLRLIPASETEQQEQEQDENVSTTTQSSGSQGRVRCHIQRRMECLRLIPSNETGEQKQGERDT